MPEALQKVSRTASNANQSRMVPEPMRMTSSTNNRCVRVSEGENFIPLMRPLFLASLIIKLSPSMTRMNSSGDNGQPCLIPLDAVKNLEGVPLTSKPFGCLVFSEDFDNTNLLNMKISNHLTHGKSLRLYYIFFKSIH